MQIPTLILSQLVHNEDYTRKVFPYIKPEYFGQPFEKAIFAIIKQYMEKYNKRLNQEVLRIEIENIKGLNETLYAQLKTIIEELVPEEEPHDVEWLIDITEQWCKSQAIYNGLTKSLAIYNGTDKKNDTGAIVSILEDAIAVSFDTHIGHDWMDDAEARFEYYHRTEDKIPFDIPVLNEITNNGVTNKTLSLIMGGIHVGKTHAMCHFAAANMMDGKNVLYITMEISEEEIGRRIDANLLDWPINELEALPKDLYDAKHARIRDKTPGKLIIKEYPTGGANINHFRHVLHELRFKKKFKPDIIYIDYLNLCSSARVKMGGSINLYSYVMFITQEVRGFAIENNLPIFSATQLNREGFGSADPDMTHIAESFGTGATADMILIFTLNEDMANLNQLCVKQIKNRFGDMYKKQRFMLGRDTTHMRLFGINGDTSTSSFTNQYKPPTVSQEERKAIQEWT